MNQHQNPPQNVPPVDLGNPYLAAGPALMTVSKATLPGAPTPSVVLTIRTPSTTLTVMLGRDDALTWARNLRAEAQGVSALVVPQNGHVG
jgi:hypothetical protein